MKSIRIYSAFILSILCLAVSISSATQINENELQSHLLYNEANEAFALGEDYTKPLNTYLSILEQRGPSINLLGNISNCYYKLEKLGYARLFLERALLIDPNNPDIRNNYRVILSKLGREKNRESKLTTAIKSVASNNYFIASWILLIAQGTILLSLIIKKRTGAMNLLKRKGTLIPSILLISASFTCFWLSGVSGKPAKYGIVLESDTALRQSPFESAEEQHALVEGERLEILDQHEQYYLCRISSKNGKGWISSKYLAAIAPDSFNPQTSSDSL